MTILRTVAHGGAGREDDDDDEDGDDVDDGEEEVEEEESKVGSKLEREDTIEDGKLMTDCMRCQAEFKPNELLIRCNKDESSEFVDEIAWLDESCDDDEDEDAEDGVVDFRVEDFEVDVNDGDDVGDVDDWGRDCVDDTDLANCFAF